MDIYTFLIFFLFNANLTLLILIHSKKINSQTNQTSLKASELANKDILDKLHKLDAIVSQLSLKGLK